MNAFPIHRLKQVIPLLVFALIPLRVASAMPPVQALAQSRQPLSPALQGTANPQGLSYLTRLAGPGTDNAWDMAVDASGNAYIAGMTDSKRAGGFAGAVNIGPGGGFDAFVVKLKPDGKISYAVKIGGSALDQASKIAVDSAGNAYIAGYTYSTDFPTTAGAYDRTFNGGSIDAFVTKLGPTGKQLAYSTFLGGNADDYGGGIAVDAAGEAFVTGYTESTDFPTTAGAFDRTFNGVSDVMVTKLNASGSDLVYSTFAGGSSIDIGYDIAVDASGSAFLTGQTQSQNFPTTPGAFSQIYNGGQADAFVLKVAPDGSALDYGTYLGGSQFEDAKSIGLDASGDAFVAGRTESLNFPTTAGAYDTTYNGGRDVFVSRLNPSGSDLIYSTFVGGGDQEEGAAIALRSDGTAYVGGWTYSPDFPTTPNAFDPTYNGDADAFVFSLDPTGSQLQYSTFLGTATPDYGRGIGIDMYGNAYLTGYTGFSNVDVVALKLSF